MSNIIKTETTTHNVLFVEVPKEATRIEVIFDYFHFKDGGTLNALQLPSSGFKLLTDDSTKVTEEMAVNFVDKLEIDGDMLYRDHNSPYGFSAALKSYASLKASVGVVDVNTMGEMLNCDAVQNLTERCVVLICNK